MTQLGKVATKAFFVSLLILACSFTAFSQNTVSGTFTVTEDPVLVSGNVWYQLDTLEYSTVSDDGTV